MRKYILFITVLFIITLFVSCSKKENDKNRDDSEYKIYYIDKNTSELVEESYTPTGKAKEELVKEFLDAMRKEPKNIFYQKALPDTVIIKDFSFSEEDQLTLNFDSTYSELKGINEVLTRAAIVKTLSQIKELKYIEFYVNGMPLVDSNKEIVGLMTSQDFIDSTGEDTNYPISLFFADETGKKLKEKNMTIYFTGTSSIEEYVVEQLINGPTEIGMFATIPEGTTLLNVTTKDGICYVDFNEAFLNKNPDITDKVAIYSVVNSLVELPGINKVQFMINGEVRKTYGEGTNFDGFFERKLSLVDKTGDISD